MLTSVERMQPYKSLGRWVNPSSTAPKVLGPSHLSHICEDRRGAKPLAQCALCVKRHVCTNTLVTMVTFFPSTSLHQLLLHDTDPATQVCSCPFQKGHGSTVLTWLCVSCFCWLTVQSATKCCVPCPGMDPPQDSNNCVYVAAPFCSAPFCRSWPGYWSLAKAYRVLRGRAWKSTLTNLIYIGPEKTNKQEFIHCGPPIPTSDFSKISLMLFVNVWFQPDGGDQGGAWIRRLTKKFSFYS